MFNLIRRLSNGVILRPDRPWADDATSNAPTKGKKRRLSFSERNYGHESTEESRTKKIRGESDAPETPQPEPEPQQQDEKGVKEVTKGVKDVELNDSQSVSPSGLKEGDEVKPESVPLPGEDDAAELEEGADASPPSEDASDDIASSADEEGVADGPSEPGQPEGQETSEGEKAGEEKTKEAQVPEPEMKKGEDAPAEPAP